MPLTKRQFELRIDEKVENWMRQIYQHLAAKKNLAYSNPELHQMVLARSAGKEEFERALKALVQIGAVERRDVDYVPYYAFLPERDTKTWEPKVIRV